MRGYFTLIYLKSRNYTYFFSTASFASSLFEIVGGKFSFSFKMTVAVQCAIIFTLSFAAKMMVEFVN